MNRPRSGRRPKALRAAQRVALGAAVLTASLVADVRGTQDAIANGDTRSLTLVHMHTKESATITFRRDGRYDGQALAQMNWLLRDWRLDQQTKMDARLFDIVWQVYREVGSREPIYVASAYRSPGTNAMLRRRSRAVSETSQHMAGKAMDLHFPDVPVERVRAVAMRAQHGGVGYYPNAHNAFVHLDTGSVRAWPRMTRDQLVRLFPTGKTVHIPADGQPLPGYEEAKAEVLARGGTVAGYTAYASAEETGGRRRSLWATLFGIGDDEDTEYYRASQGTAVAAYAPSSNSEDGGARGLLALFRPAQPQQQAEAAQAPAAPQASALSRRGGRQQGAAPTLESPPQLSAPIRVASADGSLPVGQSLLGQRGPQAQVPEDEAEGTEARAPSPAPLPPRRPSDLAFRTDAPLPPARPIAVAGLGVMPLVGSAPEPASVGSTAARAALGPVPLGRGPAPTPSKADPGSETASPAPSGTRQDQDDRAALRALFAAAATTPSPAPRARVETSRAKPQPVAPGILLADMGPALNVGFASNAADAPSTSRFSGPAVKPLPVLR